MGLIRNIANAFKKKPSKENLKLIEWLNGTTPIYNQYGEGIYVNEVVQDCIFRIVSELKKLKPLHIKENEQGDVLPIKDSKVARALRYPNPLMTTSDFIEKICWNLFLNYNSFIYPMYNNEGELEYYPLQPHQVDWLQDDSGKMFVKFHFSNNYEQTIPYDKVIHIRYKYSVNDFMGGNKNGQADTDALKKVLKMNDTLLDGLAKQMKMSMNITGVAKLRTMQNTESQMNMIKEFEQKLQENESGILPIDVSAEFEKLNNKIDFISAETLKFIDEKIYRPFGVSAAIMKVDYSPDQHAAFYQTALEHIVVSLNQGFTKGTFTKKEMGFGNEIRFFSKPLQHATLSQKLESIRILGDSGTLFENEKRTTLGLMPLAELVGVRMMSKNYGTVDSVQNMDKIGGTENE